MVKEQNQGIQDMIKIVLKTIGFDFSGSLMAMTLCSQVRVPEFNHWSGTRSHMLQLRPGTAK